MAVDDYAMTKMQQLAGATPPSPDVSPRVQEGAIPGTNPAPERLDTPAPLAPNQGTENMSHLEEQPIPIEGKFCKEVLGKFSRPAGAQKPGMPSAKNMEI